VNPNHDEIVLACSTDCCVHAQKGELKFPFVWAKVVRRKKYRRIYDKQGVDGNAVVGSWFKRIAGRDGRFIGQSNGAESKETNCVVGKSLSV